MSYIVNGTQVKSVGIILEPSSYGTDITPEDMQSGRTAVSKGKIVTGTGRAFEFASYGQTELYNVVDENGNNKIGCMIPEPFGSNVLFVSSTSNGDHIAQDIYAVNVTTGRSSCVGKNLTTHSDVRVYYSDGYMYVYLDDLSNANTIISYFEGKDNLI